MALSLEDFLSSCDLSHLLPAFLEQNIDSVELLEYLTDAQIQAIATTFGDQVRFKKGLGRLRAPSALETTSLNEVQVSFDEPSCSQNLSDNESAAKRKKADDIVATAVDSPVLFVVQNEAPFIRTVESSPAVENSSIDCSLNSSFTSITGRAVAEVDLATLIQADVIGRAIWEKYKKTNALVNKERSDLSEIIISHFLNLSYKLNNETLNELAVKIVQLFPTELRATYFVSPIPKRKSRFNKPEVAKGRLVDKHRNKLTALRRLQSSASVDCIEQFVEPTQIEKDAKIWLASNKEPVDLAIENWKLSRNLRKHDNKNESIEDFYEEWPILKTTLATQLVNIDFEDIFKIPPIEDLAESFDNFFQKILNIRRSKLSTADETFLNLIGDSITSDSKVAIKLYLLSSLIPPRGRIRIAAGKQWKPTTNECRDGYIQHVKTLEEVNPCKARKIDDMFKRGMTVQPYILLVGTHLGNICASYVIINDYTYKADSVLNALDFAFKAYNVLVAKYPFECQHIWFLVQRLLYKLTTKYDVTIPYIQDLL